MLNRLMHLANTKLKHQIDSFILGILLLNSHQHALRLLTIALVPPTTRLPASPLRGFPAVLLYHAQADDLVAVVDQLVNQPFQCRVGVLVGVRAAEERAGALGILVITVFAVQREREVARIAVVEGVERDALLEFGGWRRTTKPPLIVRGRASYGWTGTGRARGGRVTDLWHELYRRPAPCFRAVGGE